MGTLWIPGAERLPCSKPGGVITSTAPPRAVWHTTEAQPGTAAVWASMIRVLNSKSAEPQILYDPVTDRLGQFMPLNLSGRALKNDGTYQTNRTGRVCVQIEVIAYAAKPFTNYWKPGENFKAMIAALRSWGIAVDSWPAGPPPRFVADPPHNVPESPRSRQTWLSKGGCYSHSQIPGNNHGDPGGVDVIELRDAGKPQPPTTTKDWFDMATLAELEALLKKVVPGIVADELNKQDVDLWINGTGKTQVIDPIKQIKALLEALPDATVKELMGEQLVDMLQPKPEPTPENPNPARPTIAFSSHVAHGPTRTASLINPPTEV